MGLIYAANSLLNIIIIAEKCFGMDGLTREELLRINSLTYKADIQLVLERFQQTSAADFICLRDGHYTLRNKDRDFKAQEKLEDLTKRLGYNPKEIFCLNKKF